MLDIYRIDHIGQVVPDLEPQVKMLEGLFGFRKLLSWENTQEGHRGVLFKIPGAASTRWELLAPLGENSPFQSFLDTPRGPGLHHVAVEVTDLDAAREELGRLEIEPSLGPSGRWIDALFGPPDGPEGLPFRIFGPSSHLNICGGDGSPQASGTSGDFGPSLGIAGLFHICQAHPNRDEISRWYERAMGMREIYRTPDGAWADMATLMLTVPGSQIIWEIIQPVGEDSHVQRYINQRGAGLHHVTLEVHDWERAMAACEHHGIPTFGLTEGETDGARWCDNFIHPKQTGGVLVQLFWEERPGVWARSDKIPTKH